MVEKIRSTTQLSHELSKLATITVLTMLVERVGGEGLERTIGAIIDEITDDRVSAEHLYSEHLYSRLYCYCR